MEFTSGLYGFGIPFLIILTVLVFVHEMGHYLIARYNGVRIEVFSIGFGPELFGWNDKKGTRWKFCVIPLGGYVKMFGDGSAASTPDGNLRELTEEEQQYSFHHKRLMQRVWIVIGGPLANYIFAALVFAGLFASFGQPYTPAIVGEVLEGSAADQSGILPEDRIVSIDGRGIETFEDIQRIVESAAGVELNVTLERDSSLLDVIVVPELVTVTDVFGTDHRIGRLGISRSGAEYLEHSIVSALWEGTKETVFLTGAILRGVYQIVTGQRSFKELGGPVKIAQMSGQAAEIGLIFAIQFTAILSVNLGLINLFPIPMLDGGHLLFYAIEGVRGRPLGERAQEIGFRIGLALVLTLVVMVTFNDLVSIKLFDFLGSLVG